MSGCSECLPIRTELGRAGSSVAITTVGNILAVNLTEIARVSIPDIDAPVLVEGWCTIQNTATGSATNADVTLGIAPISASGSTPALNMIDAHGELNIGNASVEPPGRKMRVAVWLEASSPGQYMLGAYRDTGSDAAQATVNGFLQAVVFGLRGG